MTVLLGKLHLPFQLPAAPPAPARPWLPALGAHDPLVLALLFVGAALCALALVLRRALPARRRAEMAAPGAAGLTTPMALAFDEAQRTPPAPPAARSRSPSPTKEQPRLELALAPAPKRRLALPHLPTLDLKTWNVLARLVELFDLLEDDAPHVQIVEKPSLTPASAPLAAPPPRRRTPPGGHRRTQSMHGGPGRSGAEAPPPLTRPLSAAKLIMSRHVVRKPYRPPPVPGSPRSQPLSRLVGEAA